MPIKPIPPSPKRRTPYYTARGSHLGVFVDRSLKTSDRALAKKLIKQIEHDIERGAIAPRGTLGFGDAASAYMKGEQAIDVACESKKSAESPIAARLRIAAEQYPLKSEADQAIERRFIARDLAAYDALRNG